MCPSLQKILKVQPINLMVIDVATTHTKSRDTHARTSTGFHPNTTKLLRIIHTREHPIRVRMVNVMKPEFEGVEGEIVNRVATKDMFRVKFPSLGRILRLKPSNLQLVGMNIPKDEPC